MNALLVPAALVKYNTFLVVYKNKRSLSQSTVSGREKPLILREANPPADSAKITNSLCRDATCLAV